MLEELGTYDPMVPETDARAVLNAERIEYWLNVGAQPSEKVAVLIKKYGTNGTHGDVQKAAIERLAQPRQVPEAGKPVSRTAASEVAGDGERPPEANGASETQAPEQAGGSDSDATSPVPAEST